MIAASPERPRALVVVTGTGTDVGKTWVACELARDLRRRGVAVAARKPAQSFDPGVPSPTDADLLASATGERASEVCPSWRWYEKAMAPPMAAESLGRPAFSLTELLGEIGWPAGAGAGIVEQAGGLGSPQATDGDGVEMVELLEPDLVVVVAPPGLGTLGNVSLVSRALGSQRFTVYLNRFDPGDELHAANRRWLSERLGLAVAVTAGELAAAVTGLAGWPA